LFAAEPAAATSELNFTGNWTAMENQQPNIAAKKFPSMAKSNDIFH